MDHREALELGEGEARPNFDEIDSDRIEYAIDHYIHHERNRKILKRRILDGICFEPLADEFDMSVRQIKYIVSKYEWTVFKHSE